MRYELSAGTDPILNLHVTETPPADEAQALNARILGALTDRGWSRVIVDYRAMEKSDYDAGTARRLLLQMDRLLACRATDPVEPRHIFIALVSAENTFGHGIARMTMGHAYDLRHLDLRHFTDAAVARDWLLSRQTPTLRTLAGNGPE